MYNMYYGDMFKLCHGFIWVVSYCSCHASVILSHIYLLLINITENWNVSTGIFGEKDHDDE